MSHQSITSVMKNCAKNLFIPALVLGAGQISGCATFQNGMLDLVDAACEFEKPVIKTKYAAQPDWIPQRQCVGPHWETTPDNRRVFVPYSCETVWIPNPKPDTSVMDRYYGCPEGVNPALDMRKRMEMEARKAQNGGRPDVNDQHYLRPFYQQTKPQDELKRNPNQPPTFRAPAPDKYTP